MKKVLFVATVDSHINNFHLPYMKWFKEHGYEVHVATNSIDKIYFCDKKHKLEIRRSPFSIKKSRRDFSKAFTFGPKGTTQFVSNASCINSCSRPLMWANESQILGFIYNI